MSETRRLYVLLNGVHVGNLDYNNGSTTFRTLESYVETSNRPILGQLFEDDLRRVHRASNRLPAWFSNLLPEGPLRELVATASGVRPTAEFFILGHLGEDLPGAVTVIPETPADLVPTAEDLEDGGSYLEASEFDFKFSLAGVQLKLSVLRGNRGLTVPVGGRGGDYIAKLPDSRHAGVPENEWTMMEWARAVGIDVPDANLVEVSTIAGLPSSFLTGDASRAFVIKRFDRHSGEHIHIEDFAQVLNHYPTPRGKYGGANYETVGRIIYELGGESDLHEFVRRIVAVVVMGNGDAHLKNFSLIYEDAQSARLAPAYDLVSTLTYVMDRETLALKLAKSRHFGDVGLESFRRLARKIGLPSDRDLDAVVAQTAEGMRHTWAELRKNAPMAPDAAAAVTKHLRIVRLP